MERLQQNVAATLTVVFTVGETLTDATGNVTVAITNIDGATVASGTATKTAGVLGTYTYDLPPQAALGPLTATWTGTVNGSTWQLVTYAEVVGSRLFTLAEARASDPALANNTKWTTSDLDAARRDVEVEFETITGLSFYPRLRREVMDGSGTKVLLGGSRLIRRITAATVDDLVYDSTLLAKLQVSRYGELINPASGWNAGDGNVTITYEYGMDEVPADIKRVALIRLRSMVMSKNSAIPDRATSFTTVEGGGTYSLATPGRNGWETAIPEVDAVLKRWSMKTPGVY